MVRTTGEHAARLFTAETFTSHSGLTLHWKIECDALTDDDWAGAARIAIDYLPPFGHVHPIPRGGIAFGNALWPYATDGPILIVDDVCTTGNSLRAARQLFADAHRLRVPPLGVVLFARGGCPSWVTPLFSLPVPRAADPDLVAARRAETLNDQADRAHQHADTYGTQEGL